MRAGALRLARSLVAAGCALIALAPAAAAAQGAAEPSNAELREEVRARDAIIADLLRRVDALERQGARAPVPAAAPVVPDQLSPPPPLADAGEIDRALERTLVQSGALLLAPGQVELAPQFSFAHQELAIPAVVAGSGGPAVGMLRLRSDQLAAVLGLRLGLPLDTQLELSLPWRRVRQSVVASTGLIPLAAASATAADIGDPTIALAHTLVRERGWLPDLVARVRWTIAGGDTGLAAADAASPLAVTGFGALGGSLTAIKRQDPLVFVAGAAFDTAFARRGVGPGDSVGLTLGAYLAASPETSLRFVLDQRFIGETRIGGLRQPGTGRTIALFTLGAATILHRGVLLDVAASAGLTADSPDYGLQVSLPIRF